MYFTVDLKSKEGSIIRLSLSSIDSEVLPKELVEFMNGVEIVEVVLERISQTSVVSFHTLMQIVCIVENELKKHDNVILFFYCDDRSNIYMRNRRYSPQEYRSLLFSHIISRYLSRLFDLEYVDAPLLFHSEHDIYMHLIYRPKHQLAVEVLKGFLANMAVK